MVGVMTASEVDLTCLGGRYLEGIRKVSGRYLGGIWKCTSLKCASVKKFLVKVFRLEYAS